MASQKDRGRALQLRCSDIHWRLSTDANMKKKYALALLSMTTRGFANEENTVIYPETKQVDAGDEHFGQMIDDPALDRAEGRRSRLT